MSIKNCQFRKQISKKVLTIADIGYIIMTEVAYIGNLRR
nr:MAG TPA: hypothetical protein [Caudoviricetes sp.]